ncbi:MAG: phosphoenolpyruvate synthase, partial [Gemmatimonadetes bacterium]|nr:phosphoenolpyruvate synthase [Gemmatimonadota bacterium]
MILPLHSEAPLSLAGGKGANLARLVRAGLPVPPGFILTTVAYRRFVAANRLQESILRTARAAPADDPGALAAATTKIRAGFAAGQLPSEIGDAVRAGYAALGHPPVAVRSSATTEDLPELSFAGQQDTLLNVMEERALLAAVVQCWSSLWTARAIGYRAQHGIDHAGAELAVVVQEMVPSDVSGVLFTANPLTGKRTETVIDATWGLGEALVGGKVEPDHYVVDDVASRVLERKIGGKALSIRPSAAGGTLTLAEAPAEKPALPEDAVLELARLGARVAELFGVPQDIEWARAGGRSYLLQSRPITSLFPLPQGMRPEPLQLLFSVGAVQGMLEPFTPLGQDVFRVVLRSGLGGLGERVSGGAAPVLDVAAERIWFNITGLACGRVTRRFMRRAFQVLEPDTGRILDVVLADPALATGARRLRLPSVRLGWVLSRALVSLITYLARPDAARARVQQRIERIVAA